MKFSRISKLIKLKMSKKIFSQRIFILRLEIQTYLQFKIFLNYILLFDPLNFRSLLSRGSMTYKGSGVDIDAGDSLVKNIVALTNTTKRDGVAGSLGDFGGFFDLRAAGYKDPFLVSGTDGVGTKLKVITNMHKKQAKNRKMKFKLYVFDS